MTNASQKDFRRVVSAVAIIVACPLYVFCGLAHVCMAGHMQHAPYPAWHYVADIVWTACFVIAGVLCWRSNLRLRKTVFAFLLLLFLSRMPLGSGGGGLFVIEVPLLAFLVVTAIRSLFGGAADWNRVSREERRQHRGAVLHRWRVVFVALVATVLAAWASIRIYWHVRRASAEKIAVQAVPFRTGISLSPGAACALRLPNGKTVAVWCRKQVGMMAMTDDSGLGFEYGEVPFKRLQRETIQLPEGGTTGGEYLSYIRQGPVMSSGKRKEYVLYVDTYSVSLITDGPAGSALPLTVSVREATEKERVPENRKRAHYLKALASVDPATRLDAIRELGEMVSMGSTYAGDPKEIGDAIRPFLKDADPKIREEALVRLRVMGDEAALLEMLTPRPKDEYLKPNWGWTIAGWCRKDQSERLAKHVLSFLDTDDPALQEFALAFFSCYKIPYLPAQPYVARLLRSGSPAVRAAAASAIRFTCERKEAARLLYEALGDPSDEVLSKALVDVSYFHDSIPVARIIPLMAHTNLEVRRLAAGALDCSGSPDAVAPLLRASRDASPEVRAAAAVTLGRIADPKAYARLVELLEDSDAGVRESAINGLRWFGDKRAIPLIGRLKDDKDEKVRDMASHTTRELSNK